MFGGISAMTCYVSQVFFKTYFKLDHLGIKTG